MIFMMGPNFSRPKFLGGQKSQEAQMRFGNTSVIAKGNAAFPSSTYLSSFWPLLQLLCDSFHKNISGGDKTPPGIASLQSYILV